MKFTEEQIKLLEEHNLTPEDLEKVANPYVVINFNSYAWVFPHKEGNALYSMFLKGERFTENYNGKDKRIRDVSTQDLSIKLLSKDDYTLAKMNQIIDPLEIY